MTADSEAEELRMSRQLFDLKGRVALVTGGSKGLGRAMARGFAQAGADVVISSRHADELDDAAAEIRSAAGVKVAHVVADMTRRDDVQKLADAALATMGRVDILVNNAGSNTPQPIDEIRDEDWDRILELNLNSCMALTRYLVGPMKERHWGRIIHISSILGLSSAPGRSAYSATKSALIGLTRAGANDLGRFGITVNCLAPGPFLTDLPMSLLTEEQRSALAQRTALGRWGNPDELVGPALLLASDAGSYITGATLVVDGGVLARTF
jgi:NAD(P)-dependent dehydrogenase (short-subunit alcohol dehydrogenase family)